MRCTIEKKIIFPTIWQSSKIFRSLSSGVFVENSGMSTIKELMNRNERVVLLPTYKSFADLLVILYAFASHNIEIPF